MNHLVGVNVVILRPTHETSSDQDGLEVLLIKRKFPPFNGKWALPGGMLKKDESNLAAVNRELKTETGLEIKKDSSFIKLSTRSREGRDPRGHVDSHPYLAVIAQNEGEDIGPGQNVADARWFLLSEIEELAFDHGAILCEALGYLWEGMPNFVEKFKKIKIDHFYKKSDFKDALVLFPGSFNPWHEGHLSCLKLCPNQNILIVPDVSPWKTLGDNSCLWKKYSQFCENLNDTVYSVYPGFLGKESANPTIDWLPKVVAREKWLLIGDDNFFQIESWKKFSELLSSLKGLYVVSRTSENEENAEYKKIVNSLSKSHPKLKIIYLNGNTKRDISSTKLRSGAKT